PGNRREIRGRRRRAGGAEVIEVDAAAEESDTRVKLPLGEVELVASGEDEIRPSYQVALFLRDLGRGVRKLRELVHAVVDDGERIRERVDLRRHERRVEPV